MDTFFNPGSIAVVGASRKQNLGNHVVLNLKAGFRGAVYPINPNYNEIEGLPSYPSIAAVPGPVDLAIVLVPAAAVPAVLEDCAVKGTRRVIIESAGFSETGEAGHDLQRVCNRIAHKAGIRLWGPNCMGVVDVRKQHFFTFMHPRIRAEGNLMPGRISLIVQSGMMSAIFLAELGERGIGVAKACSIGNRADVDECDILPYLINDPDTDAIAMYLESIPRGRLFARLARKSSKPIVLLKGGQSGAGAKAAMSHTSSLSGNSRLLGSILSNAGVNMAASIFQMMDMANTLAAVPKMNPAGRVAILTLSGGAGILACDALEKSGLSIADLSAETRAELAQIFPPWMPPANPIDLFPAVALRGRAPAYRSALDAVMRDPQVDVIILHAVTGLEEAILDLADLKQRADQMNKTVVFWLMGLKEGKAQFSQNARENGFVVHSDGPRLAECLKAVAHFNACKPTQSIAVETGETPSEDLALDLQNLAGNKTLDEFDSKSLLRQWKLPVVEEAITADFSTAEAFAHKVGFPVVLKGLVPEKAHKSEHGLVKLGLSDLPQLQAAFDRLQKQLAGTGRILIQKQMNREYELIAGYLTDDQFGPCVMFGLGGILAELEPDVAFALAPLEMPDALMLIHSLRNRKLMQGFRGMPPLDERVTAQLLINLGALGSAHPQISQIDINPLLIHNGHPMAVDANIILKH